MYLQQKNYAKAKEYADLQANAINDLQRASDFTADVEQLRAVNKQVNLQITMQQKSTLGQKAQAAKEVLAFDKDGEAAKQAKKVLAQVAEQQKIAKIKKEVAAAEKEATDIAKKQEIENNDVALNENGDQTKVYDSGAKVGGSGWPGPCFG